MRYIFDAHSSQFREARLESIARNVTKRFGSVGDISVAFVTMTEMKRLNALYRGKHRPTDVLSFSFISGPRRRGVRSEKEYSQTVDSNMAGEIILCRDVVRRKAREHGRTLYAEVEALIVHATLHIMGYDHEKDREAHAMEALEDRLVAEVTRRLAKS